MGIVGCSGEMQGKRNWPWPCFANFVGMKVTPSGLNLLCSRLRFDKSADLEGRVRASNMAVLDVRLLMDICLLLPRDCK